MDDRDFQNQLTQIHKNQDAADKAKAGARRAETAAFGGLVLLLLFGFAFWMCKSVRNFCIGAAIIFALIIFGQSHDINGYPQNCSGICGLILPNWGGAVPDNATSNTTAPAASASRDDLTEGCSTVGNTTMCASMSVSHN
jgi:hypothetical protein